MVRALFWMLIAVVPIAVMIYRDYYTNRTAKFFPKWKGRKPAIYGQPIAPP